MAEVVLANNDDDHDCDNIDNNAIISRKNSNKRPTNHGKIETASSDDKNKRDIVWRPNDDSVNAAEHPTRDNARSNQQMKDGLLRDIVITQVPTTPPSNNHKINSRSLIIVRSERMIHIDQPCCLPTTSRPPRPPARYNYQHDKEEKSSLSRCPSDPLVYEVPPTELRRCYSPRRRLMALRPGAVPVRGVNRHASNTSSSASSFYYRMGTSIPELPPEDRSVIVATAISEHAAAHDEFNDEHATAGHDHAEIIEEHEETLWDNDVVLLSRPNVETDSLYHNHDDHDDEEEVESRIRAAPKPTSPLQQQGNPHLAHATTTFAGTLPWSAQASIVMDAHVVLVVQPIPPLNGSDDTPPLQDDNDHHCHLLKQHHQIYYLGGIAVGVVTTVVVLFLTRRAS